MFFAPRPDSFSAVLGATCPAFMFCPPARIFGGAKCVGSHFHILRAQTHFRRYRGRRVPFSCFALPDMFLAVWRVLGPVFMFCAPEHVFIGSEGVRSPFSSFALPHLGRYRGCQVPFSCFALLDSFLAVPWASGPIFMFYVPGLIFGGIKGVESRFHVLCSRTYFVRYRGRRVPFSCFPRPDSFSAI
jgi:hypothetical protein